ncbi:hypothetical protein evm_002317 [Chilo suppressalis]|nr:hypothetical protein evm_002317 [Chilo suppressalis]
MVVILHALIPVIPTVENPAHFEAANESHSFHFVGNVHIVMQTFFFMSGLFLVYTTQITNERNPITWRSLPRAIFLRWLRLSPVHHVMLLYTATWFKFAPHGPHWEGMVGGEVEDCQQTWPMFVLYHNNYVFGQRCSIHHWSTAADFHLHIVGLMILTISPTERIRDVMIWLFTIIGILLPAIETYNRDLHGTFIAGFKYVQNQRGIFEDPTFNYLYKRTHTNIPAFGIGMLYGLFLYKWMKKPEDTSKYKKYVYWFWLLFPMFLSIVYMNAVLIHREGSAPAPLALRVFFALVQKPAWSLLLVALTFGVICQIENVYRRILEWPGWVPLMKLTYCTYNVNIVISLWMYGSTSQLTFASDLSLLNGAAGLVVITFIFATVLWLLVEAPCNNLARKLFPDRQSILKVAGTTKKMD